MGSRRGRPRKAGPRYKSGRLNVRRLSDDKLAALQPHRRDLPESERLSPKAITTLGQLNLQRRITNEQFEAGERYQQVVNAYRAVIASHDPCCQALPGWGRMLSAEEAERRTVAYDDATCALDQCARDWRNIPDGLNRLRFGHEAVKWVNRVAIYGETCPISAFPALVCGLQALVIHFGLMPKALTFVRR